LINLAEFGFIIGKSLKANWDNREFEDFVWRVSQLLDDPIDEIDPQDYKVEVN